MKKSKRPAPAEAPDTARVYERAKPQAESGMGKLSSPKPRQDKNPDRIGNAVKNRQANRQINSEEEE